MKKNKFVFDLDDTITTQKILLVIAKHFGIEEKIAEIVSMTALGNIPFVESSIKKIFLLSKLPVSEIDALLKTIALYPRINEFIQSHKEDCVLVTENLNCWIKSLSAQIDCNTCCSEGLVENDKVKKIIRILKKENIVKMLQQDGFRVVFVGNRNDDMEAMRVADVSIASGLVCEPVPSVLSITDYLVYSEEALWRQLNQLS